MKKVTTIKAAPGFDETGKRIRKLRVCAYCRVSTNHEDQQNSFDAQIRHFSGFIENNPEWEMAGIYADEGVSGKSKQNRTEFLRMIRDAENHKLDLIITKSISRFARNTADCIEAVRMLKGLGVEVFFEKENINTLNAESELVLTILSSIAEEELASMSQNIRWANQKRFKQGKLQLVTERFMGYERDGKGGLIINEEQAKVVRRIYDDYISGLGITRIARGLEADRVKNVSGNVSWAASTILGMLKNEKYVGDAILQKTVTSNSITFKRKPNEGEAPMYYIKNNHPPIIEREKFELVQELIKDRCRGKGYSPEMAWKYQNRYPFTHKIFCGHCGNSFRHIVRNSTHPSRQYYWGCGTYIDRKTSACEMRPIKDETLKKLFVRVFNKLLMNRSILTSFAATLRMVNEVKFSNGQLKDLDAEIDNLFDQEHVLLKLNEKGVADKAMLRIEDCSDWQYTMVRKILMDERYLGTEKYPPILSREVFEAAQEKRKNEKEKAISTRHQSCNGKRVYPFSGLIKCGSCGSNYVRGIQRVNALVRKATWRCRNYHLKNEGKCKASGNVYEEVLEVVCVEAYNTVLKECASGEMVPKRPENSVPKDETLEVLIKETIHQMKKADDKRLKDLQTDLNILIAKRTVTAWNAAPLDLSQFETEKIIRHFSLNPEPMADLDIEKFKVIFERIEAFEPGKLKLILKNGSELLQEYKPMRGQIENAKKYRNYTCKADKRT